VAGRAHGVRFLRLHFQSEGEGRFIGRARGRVLETALTLHALKLADLDPAWQQRLRDHRMNECVRVLFHHGVRHVFTPYLTPSHFTELTPR